ncbi:MAG TPA: hypothetical protein VMP41_16030 [Acidimicrobiales bacterium]|nr:hypothetical protein [Acidimicrobiales bacterium]
MRENLSGAGLTHETSILLLGIRLAKRTDPDVLQKMIQDVQSIEKLEEGRRTVAIAQLADKLKSDFEKQYVAEFRRV